MSPQIRFWPLLILGAVTMSLGWGLRGTIGGGPIGAMIPGLMISLAIALGLNRTRDLCAILVLGTIGVGLGGQMTYGQTLGFVKLGPTWWGLWGATVKGAVWGLTGGVLLGLGFVRRRYRLDEILWGLIIMLMVTTIGWKLLDEPKWYYFSNRLDKPREEIWGGLLLGGIALQGYLLMLRRETVSLNFALWGTVAGAIGFGGGACFFVVENEFLKPRGIPAWKSMEFFFGLMLGIGYSIAAYSMRNEILKEEERQIETEEAWKGLPRGVQWLLACLIPLSGLWFHFNVQFQPIFSLSGSMFIIAGLASTRAGWHIALSLTIVAFLRDQAYTMMEQKFLSEEFVGWGLVTVLSLIVVPVVEVLPRESRTSTLVALLLVGWAGIGTALGKFWVQNNFSPNFVVLVFLAEGVGMSLMAWGIQRRNQVISGTGGMTS